MKRPVLNIPAFRAALSTAVILGLAPLLPASGNLFPEGGMEGITLDESAGEGTPWRVLNGMAEVKLDAETAKSGKQSLAISPLQPGVSWIRSARIKVLPHMEYTLRVTVLSRSLEGQKRGPFYGIRVYESDGGWNPPDGKPYLAALKDGEDSGREWVVKSATFVTRENTKWLYVGVLVNGSTAGTVFLDDVELIEGR